METAVKISSLEINEWCSNKTNGLISNIMVNTNQQYEFILHGHSYFKGT